jgi:hypothetical protein
MERYGCYKHSAPPELRRKTRRVRYKHSAPLEPGGNGEYGCYKHSAPPELHRRYAAKKQSFFHRFPDLECDQTGPF